MADINDNASSVQDGAASTVDGDKSGQGAGTETLSDFDKFLKDGGQSEFDRRVAKALETQRANLEKASKKSVEDAVEEALKKERMTQEQKDEYQRKKKAEELRKREAEISRRELRATARETLAIRNLRPELIDLLNFDSPEGLSTSLDAVEKAFNAAINDGINERLKGGKAPDKAQDSGNAGLEEAIKKSMKHGFFGA